MQSGLYDFAKKVKEMGFAVKLDTNGSRPEVVKALAAAGLVDFWAMDVKSSPENYCKAAGVTVDINQIRASVAAIRASGADHEFRTTAIKGLVSREDMPAIRELVGSDVRYHVRRANLKSKLLDPALADRPDYTDAEWNSITIHVGADGVRPKES